MAKRNKKSKVTTAFLYTLGIVSILGFLAIVGNTLFNFSWLDRNVESLIFMILGVGLLFEGQILLWGKMAKSHGGLDSNEMAHIFTGVIGAFAIIAGGLSLLGVSTPGLNSIKGIVATMAIVIIFIQIWMVEQR